MNREDLIAKYSEPQKILDHGHIRLVDVMGDDSAIAQAARVSYGEGTKTVSEDRGLVRYLIKHYHTTPLEMCELKIHVKCPLFVARQWMRHRSWSYNEVSARYSEMPNEIYVPAMSQIKFQSANNKQGRGDTLDLENTAYVKEWIGEHNDRAYSTYKDILEKDTARELARTVLPVGMYTEFYAKVDLHNLLNFLRLRMDSHAQYEIRVFADAIAEIVKEWVPVAWEAFVDYRLESVSFSRMESEVIKEMVWDLFDDETHPARISIMRALMDKHGVGSKRERGEFLRKLTIV